VAITPNGAFAYVTNDLPGEGEVSVIKTSTNSVVATVPVGGRAYGVAITPNGAFAYVTNFEDSTVSVIKTATNSVVATVPILGGSYDVAITPDGAFAYVPRYTSSSVAVIDTATNNVVGAVPVGAAPFGVATTPDGALAYVTNFVGDSISVIATSTNSVVATEYRVSAPIGVATMSGVPRAAAPPQVKILSGPPRETTKQKAVFTFNGVTGGTYECSIDAGAWAPCKSGQAFGPLPPGDHRFQVRETLAGLTGPAASYRWTIDLPKACVLRVARARVFAYATKHKVRLVIHYKTYRPAKVSVSYDLVGAKGRRTLGSTSANFKTAGVFRDPESLTAKEFRQVRAAKLFKVQFRIPKAPHSCERYYTKRLTIPEKFSGDTVWFQSDSTFAP
jgi:YVTN family beta-propeller protein